MSVTVEWIGGAKDQVQETKMFKSDRFAQVATAMVGAFVLSTISIAATVVPAQAAGADQSWIASVPFGAPAHG